MTNQQNPDNNLTTKVPLSERAYEFTSLPKETQEKLLEMQNTDGDFLRIGSGETIRSVFLFVLWVAVFIGFAAIVADNVNEGILDLKRIVVFSADGFILLLWFLYFVVKLFRTFTAPIKNLVYLTPAQVIETLDGAVRYRQLKDAAEISVNRFWTDIGRRTTLDIKFDDGDAYQFCVAGTSNSKQFAATQEWREKAAAWQKEAIGNADYLKSRDIFSKIADSNTPVSLRQYRTQKENRLLIITILLFALNGAFIFFLTK